MKKLWLLFIVLLFASCTCYIKEGKYNLKYNKSRIICNCSKIKTHGILEEKIRLIKKENFNYIYCPILVCKEKNDIGIYQYWTLSVHSSTSNFFIYDGTEIEFVENGNMIYLETWLRNNGFKAKQIKKLINQINKCKVENNNNGNVF